MRLKRTNNALKMNNLAGKKNKEINGQATNCSTNFEKFCYQMAIGIRLNQNKNFKHECCFLKQISFLEDFSDSKKTA